MASFKVYKVGGAVRDMLLGLPVKDQDWLVVGASPEQLLTAGYLPVGKDFPVFLHPETHEEYALARTERKTAPGYTGFQFFAHPDITLEQDLLRRDFTINAMALDQDGTLIDPYHGQQDLQAGILRHVSAAFSEDPVRILRAARFACRFNFSIAPETKDLMQQMVNNGEVDALVSERVWQELARALMETHPSRFFNCLADCGALAKLFPEIAALFGIPQPPQYHPEIDCGIHTMLALDRAAAHNFSLEVRFATLLHDVGKAITPSELLPRHTGHEVRGVATAETLLTRIRAPREVKELALLAVRYHGEIHKCLNMDVSQQLELLMAVDAFRRPQRLTQLLQVCISDAQGRYGHEQDEYPQAELLQQQLARANSVNTAQIAKQCINKSEIPAAIFAARQEALMTKPS